MTEEQLNLKKSRCRRKGLRFYLGILFILIAIAAAVMYYSPFKPKKPKWRGSASIQRDGKNYKYDRYGRKRPTSKMTELEKDVKRIKGNEPRTLANLLPLG